MVSSQLTLVRIKSLLKHAALTDPRVLPGGCGHFLSFPFPLLNLGASSLLDTLLGTEVVMEMLEVKFSRQEVFKEGAESPAALPPLLFPPCRHSVASSSHLSPSQQCHPPYLSPPFQGQAKLFLLPFSVKGGLIIMMMLAIYLLHPGSCSTLHPHPCQMPASPRLFPCLLLLALVTGWVFSPALGYLESAAAAGWESW